MGAPGCPEFAFCTASMLKARMAFANSRREVILFSLLFILITCNDINQLSDFVTKYSFEAGTPRKSERVETTRSFDVTLN
jgi:hypothetical protein